MLEFVDEIMPMAADFWNTMYIMYIILNSPLKLW